MPDYKFRDPKTGYELTLRGDSPPTEQELEEAFAKFFPSKMPAPEGGYASYVPQHPLGEYMGQQEPRPSLSPESDFVQPSFVAEAEPNVSYPEGSVGYHAGGEGRTLREIPVSFEPWIHDPEQRRKDYEYAYPEHRAPVVPWWDQGDINMAMDPTVEESPVTPGEKRMISGLAAGALGTVIPAPFSALLPGAVDTAIEKTIGYDIPAQAARSAYNLGPGTVNFMFTPKGKALTLAAPFAPLLVGGIFTADMTLSAVEQEEQLEKNWSSMTVPQRVDALTSLAGTVGFAGLAGVHTGARIRRMAESPQYPAGALNPPVAPGQPIIPEKFKAPAPPTPAQHSSRDASRRMAKQRAIDARASTDFLLSDKDIEGPYRISRNAVMEKYGLTAEQAAQAMANARRHYRTSRVFQSVLDDSVWDLDDMFLLQERRDAGKITPEESAALENMEAAAGVSGMETNEAQWSAQKHQESEAGSRDLTIEEHHLNQENAPFAPDAPMTINERTGSVVLDPVKLKKFVEERKRAGFSEDQIEAVLDAGFREEMIHLATDRETARAYYENASPRERERAARRYSFGILGAEAFTPEVLGFEMIRYEIQKASGPIPTEYSQIHGRELADVKAADNIHAALTKIRNIVTRSRDARSRELLDRVLKNIEFAAKEAKEGRTLPPIIESEGAQPGMATKPKEAVDETGVTKSEYDRGRTDFVHFARKFEKRWVAGISARRLEDRVDAAIAKENAVKPGFGDYSATGAGKFSGWDYTHNRDYPDAINLINEKYPEFEEEYKRIKAIEKNEVDPLQVFMFEELAGPPHKLTWEEVKAILADYKSEGRKRLYELEPGLGRFVDLHKFEDTYERFDPIEGKATQITKQEVISELDRDYPGWRDHYKQYGWQIRRLPQRQRGLMRLLEQDAWQSSKRTGELPLEEPRMATKPRGPDKKWISETGEITDAPSEKGHSPAMRNLLIDPLGFNTAQALTRDQIYKQAYERGYARMQYDRDSNTMLVSRVVDGEPVDIGNLQKSRLRLWGAQTGTSVRTDNHPGLTTKFANYDIYKHVPDERAEPGMATKPTEAVDETGVTERQYFKGLDRVRRFEDDFEVLYYNRLKQEDAEIRSKLTRDNPSESEANKLTDRLEEIELEMDGYHEALANEEIQTPDQVLYRRLTDKPYNLTSEEVTAIINDYKNEGRARLYEVEPGLGRAYDQARYADTYRFFTPVEGDFQLYGETPPSMAHKPRGKKEEERAQLRNKLRQMRVEAGILPPLTEKEAARVGMRYAPGEKPSFEQLNYEELTPEKADKFIGEYFSKAAETIVKDREKRRHLPPESRDPPLSPPSYDDLANRFFYKFGPVSSSQLRDAVFENIAGGLNQATGPHIKEIVKAMKLVEAVVGRGKPGERMLSEMPDTTPGFEQLKLGIGDVRNKAQLYKALVRAERRARKAKSKESRYLSGLEEAKALHQSLRDFERPEGKSSGPIWDADEKGGLVSRTGEKITEDLPPRIRKNAIRLAELRKEMDELLYPEKQRKPEERIVIEEEPGKVGETIRTEHYQKGEEEYAPPAFEPRASVTPAMRTGQGTRIRAIGAILHEIYKQSEQSRKPVNRKEVTPEELASPLDAEEPVFRSIRGNELKDVDELGRILTSDARVGPKVANNITKRLVVLQSNTRDSVVMVDVYRHPNKTVMVRSTGQTDIHQSLSSVLKTHTPVYSILLDEPVKNFRKQYANIREFMDEFGNDAQARMRAMEMSDYPTEGARISPGTTGEVSQPGELTRGEGVFEGTFVPSPVTQAGKPASGAMGKTLLGRPAAIEVRRPLTDAEAHGVYDYITGFGEMKSLGEVGEALESLRGLMDDAVAQKSTAKLPWRAISGLAKMMRRRLEESPDVSEGSALYDVSKFLYENWQRTENRQQLVERTVANFRGELPAAGPGAGEIERAGAIREAESRLEQQALAKARAVRTKPLERERTVAPGTLPPSVEARQAEQLDLSARALHARARQEGAAREVREPRRATGQTLPEEFAPYSAEAIAEEYRKEKADDSYFDKAIKAGTEAAAEITAQLERELPRLKKETTEQYLERVRAWAEQEAAKAEADQIALADSITEGGPLPSMSIKAVGKSIKNLTHDQVVKGMRLGSEWMVDRLRRAIPPTAVETRKHLANFNESISRSQEYSGDMFRRFGDDALKASGKTGKATTWMNDFQVIAPKESAIINAKEAIEGRLQPPPEAVPIVDTGKEGNLLMGEFMQATSPDFIANGGMHNNLTAFGYDNIRDGPGHENWNKMVRGNARANADILAKQKRFKGMTKAERINKLRVEFENFFTKYKAVLDNPASGPADFFRMNQDYSRKWPRAVTHIWTGKGPFGHWEPVIHSGMFSYFNHGIRRAAMIRSFREFYPATAAYDPATGKRTVGSAFDQVMAQIRSEIPGEWHGLVNTLVRTLQGHPSENVTQTGWLREVPLQRAVSIRQPGGVALRVLAPLGDTLKTGMLSQQILLQPSELLTGGSSIFFGYRKSAMAFWLHMRSLRSGEQISMLEAIGAVDRIMYDNAWEPNSKARAAFKIFNNTLRKYSGQNLFNEWQESQAAGAAYITANRFILANRIDPITHRPMARLSWEEKNLLPQTFRAMGFGPKEVGRMMKGDPVLLGQMVRKAASFTSGGHVHPGQQSRAMANRAVQSLFWFMRYPMTRQNQLLRIWQVIGEESRAGRKAEAAKAGLLMAKFIAGTTAQGAIQTMIMTFFLAGALAWRIRKEEAEDEPFAFLFDSFRNAMGGPLQFVTRGWEDSGLHGVSENFKRIAAPINVAGETYDAATGGGVYRDMTLFDRMGKFVGRRIPMTKALKLGASTLGLSTDDVELDAAIAGLNRWKRKEYNIFFRNLPAGGDDPNKQFRIHMKKAAEAIRNNDTEGYLRARQEAVDAKIETGKTLEESFDSVNQSFLKRRLLTHPQTGATLTPDEMDKLTQRIGGEAVDKLMMYDLMLEIQAGKFD